MFPPGYVKENGTVSVRFELLSDTELIEHICENEKDVVNLVEPGRECCEIFLRRHSLPAAEGLYCANFTKQAGLS